MGTLSAVAWMIWLLLTLACLGLAGYLLVIRGGAPFTSGPVFIASRLARNNLLFPTQVAITPQEVIRYKQRVIGNEQESIAISQIASVKIATGVLWSDVIIESTGGAQPIVCHGHLNADAKVIKARIEQYQQHHYARPGSPATPGPVAAPEPARPGHLMLTLYPRAPSPATPPAPIATYPYALAQRSPGSPSLQALVLDLLDHGGPGSLLRIGYHPGPPGSSTPDMGSPPAQPAAHATPRRPA